MKPRPTIFLSGVSHEFGSFRDAVENEIEMKGCHAENQPGFPPDYRTVEEMLRRKLHDSDAVIHIVGFRFGAEPNDRPAGVDRRSYTQMEFDIARELQKPVYLFLSESEKVRDNPQTQLEPEDADATARQLAHRAAVQGTNHLYYFFKDKDQLCKLVAEIPAVQSAGRIVDISRIIKYAPANLIGREAETQLLNDTLQKVRRVEAPRPHILTFVALGGEGKTSLVAKWAAELAHQDWPGCDAAYAWSFYSQGTREPAAVSSDLFLAEALTFFGDAALANSAQGAHEKGKRLAQLVGERRALLILDGLEPLQYAPTSPTPGEFKDQGLAALLKGLAATSQGLCIVTTRYAIPDLRAFLGTTVREEKLTRLARAAGVQLLKTHGVNGSDRRNISLIDGDAKSEQVSEFEKLVEDVDGHALTLHIMGSFLKKAHQGDIRRRDRVKFEKASQKTDNNHAFHAMAAYVKWMEDGSDEAQRELAILRLMGLFDRPATTDCIAALREAPVIPGLTEPLVGLPDDDWSMSLDALQEAQLLTVNRDKAGTLVSLDAHPLLREYFATVLRSTGVPPVNAESKTSTEADGQKHGRDARATAWRVAHERLFRHLCETTKEGDQPTLEELQPLYQAVAHGCQAGLQQETCDVVYYGRIARRSEAYAVRKLGAFGSDLGAVACFFETPWSRVSPALTEADQAWLLSQAAFRLRALGRLTEALEPMRAVLERDLAEGVWMEAAISANNLSELELTLGDLAGAKRDAELSVTYADRSGDAFHRMSKRTTLADALHQAGRSLGVPPKSSSGDLQSGSPLAEPVTRSRTGRPSHDPFGTETWAGRPCYDLFAEAERMQVERQHKYPLLYSLAGFRYCDLLLAEAERAAWRSTGVPTVIFPVGEGESLGLGAHGLEARVSECRDVARRAEQTLKWVTENKLGLLTIALDHVTLGRTALYAALLSSPSPPASAFALPTSHLESAVSGLRRAGAVEFLVRGLLTRAWQRALTGARTGPESARSDLDEAWEIAERGPMPLFLADIHLHRARLFFRGATGAGYPWGSPEQDLAEARRLITKHGYGRRIPELEDAELALREWRT